MNKQYTFLPKPLTPPTLKNSIGRLFGDLLQIQVPFPSHLEDSQAMEKLTISLLFPLSPS